MANRYLIVGSGFSGCVLANCLVNKTGCSILIIDEREHIGGNCHTSRDAETGVMLHHYGPHIFNTDKKEIWDYVNSFGEFRPYVHRVKAVSNGKVYPLPVNLMTINQFFNKQFNPEEAQAFLKLQADKGITTTTILRNRHCSSLEKACTRLSFTDTLRSNGVANLRNFPHPSLSGSPFVLTTMIITTITGIPVYLLTGTQPSCNG